MQSSDRTVSPSPPDRLPLRSSSRTVCLTSDMILSFKLLYVLAPRPELITTGCCVAGGGVVVVPINESKSVRLSDITEPETSANCSFKKTCPTNKTKTRQKNARVVLSI